MLKNGFVFIIKYPLVYEEIQGAKKKAFLKARAK